MLIVPGVGECVRCMRSRDHIKIVLIGRQRLPHRLMTEITLASRVQINDDVLFQELQGETVLLNIRTGVYLGLDPVGTRIWQLLAEHETLSDVVSAMLGEYDVAEDQCARDVLELVMRMRDQHVVTLVQRHAE